MKTLSFLLSLFVLLNGNPTLNAQWTSNPLENTSVAGITGEQALPKIVTDSNGFMFVSWFTTETGSYNVRLQRLDSDGIALWGQNGILVSSEPQDTWITDYDLTVDPEGHAVITFTDLRTGDNNPVAYRVSPSGEMIWGATGIMLANNDNFDPSPKVCVTEAGNAVFAWQSVPGADSEVRLQKIAPDGQLLWGDGIILAQSGTNFTSPYLLPADGDHVFLIWHKETGPFWSPNRGLYVQKLDVDGSFVWGSDVEVYAPAPAGPVVYLELCRDDSDGVIFTWYRSTSATHFHSYVQRMDATGNLTMPANGTLASVSTDRNHMYPSSAFLSQTQEIVVFFSEQDLNQNMRGIYAQKMDLQGNRLWGEEGKQLIALSGNDYSQFMASGYGDQAICVYQAAEFGNALDAKIQAVMLDSNGDFVWMEQFIDMSTVQSEKLHSVMTGFFEGQWAAVWQDRRNDMGDIFAQNIQPDGTLGVVITGIATRKENAGFQVYPNPFNEMLTFSCDNHRVQNMTIDIFDNRGMKTGTFFIEGNSQSVYLSSLSPGIYFYRVITSNGDTFTGKVAKF
jgi:hypothetical protein